MRPSENGTLDSILRIRLALKGPLTTPGGSAGKKHEC
jgi:hypothetical protein